MVLVIIVLVGPLVGSVVMGSGTMWGFGPRGFTETGGWGLAMGLGSLSMLAFFSVLIVGIVLLARWMGGENSRSEGEPEDPALETLRHRYASGEISKEEYEERHNLLER